MCRSLVFFRVPRDCFVTMFLAMGIIVDALDELDGFKSPSNPSFASLKDRLFFKGGSAAPPLAAMVMTIPS